ncbi:hypothetical protein GCM10017667_54170 [Streptomyces filamentosus]|uniref:Uncharacterized protein n=1 Tax=Streptomyces filamentosus TaxID=67294 RepID=A0A919BU41_STRFL|nr:hypothetical protein GCM10017667_54170 [Streptomyces filamentosus]
MGGAEASRGRDLRIGHLARDLHRYWFGLKGLWPGRGEALDGVVGVAQREFEDVTDAEPTRVDEVVVDGIGDIVEAAQDEKRVVEFARVDKEPSAFADREVHALGWVVGRAVGRDAAVRGGL